MAQPFDACIIAEYDVCNAIANVNHHFAKADESGGDEVQKAWIGELSHLVVLTAFGESDFDPREVNKICTTFVDVVLYARMQSFTSLHLLDPSQEEADAVMTRLALGQDFFAALKCRAAQPALIHDPGCEACQETEATALLNKLRGTPAPAGGADDLTVHVNGFETVLYFIRERQGRVATDVITVANALHQAGVTILALGVEEHDSNVDSVPGGEAEDDDGDAKGSEVPLTLDGRADIRDVLAAYDSLMAPAPASSTSKKQGKAKNCPRLPLPSGAKVPTLGMHSKPTIMSPIPQPALMGSTPCTVLPTLNLEMGSAHLIDRASGIQYMPDIATITGGPSLQSRQPSPLPIGSIAGDECPVKRRAASPQLDPMVIDDLLTIHTAASAMPPPPLQMSAPSHSQAVTAGLMDEPYARPSPCVTAALPRRSSDHSLSRQASARSLHIASSPIERSGSQGSYGSLMLPAISLDDSPCPPAFHSHFADILPTSFQSMQPGEQIAMLEVALHRSWQCTCALEDSQHVMRSQLDAIMGALGGNPIAFATQFGVYATRVNAILSKQRELSQSLAELEERVSGLEGSDAEFPSEKEDEVIHSISTGAFDPSMDSRSGGDEGLNFDEEN
ncbi:hypothetical protein SCP_0705860 [Sparassis crispa]|uniref:Uncharacterized protein n=1 Tax=Sparassis crispa TaxID=139825 RepID=A0A401GT97_9APHY|nr:hypothetical protein SCP_0705860 [Sparassis crispa]GBE85399.1 hypothetical protein SCP_0705860 [Sparassis crispa]